MNSASVFSSVGGYNPKILFPLLTCSKTKSSNKVISKAFVLEGHTSAQLPHPVQSSGEICILYLLGTLCLFKISRETQQIIEVVNNKIVGIHFAVELLILLIESKSHGFMDIFDDAWRLLSRIPIFEEEKILFEK